MKKRKSYEPGFVFTVDHGADVGGRMRSTNNFQEKGEV
jgi:hypothetical protein